MSTELRIANTARGVAQAMPTTKPAALAVSGQPAFRADPCPTVPSYTCRFFKKVWRDTTLR
jgi:hypothetical protein